MAHYDLLFRNVRLIDITKAAAVISGLLDRSIRVYQIMPPLLLIDVKLARHKEQ